MIFLALGLLVLIITIFMFVQKIRLKSKMRVGLGRKVKDSELTSLSAWMDASSKQTGNATGDQRR